jgi:molybdate transport system ATP-binding protein
MHVFHFQHATFQKGYQAPFFEDANWEYQEGQQWGIVGPSESGKTTFLEAAAGKLHTQKGSIFCQFQPSEVYYLSFEEDSTQFHYQDYYYQQRFQAFEPDTGITVQTYLGETENDTSLFKQFIDLEALKSISLIKLSNGQTRKLRLVKALLSKPKCLIMDKPFTGLDVRSRNELRSLLDHCAQQGIHLLIADEKEEFPSSITHLLVLDQLRIAWQGAFFDYTPPIPASKKETQPLVQKMPFDNETYATLIQVTDLRIHYGEKEILKGIDWEVKQGERWCLKGPNGAGKSTLLSILYADVPQAYGQDIVLFDRKRGSGESIWDIKQKIGFYSPELQYYFKHDLTVFQVIETGLTDRLYAERRATEQERSCILSHLKLFGLLEKESSPFQTLGKSSQNAVLLLRALIKNPCLLLLDEPFLSLHVEDRTMCQALLKQYLSQNTMTLLLISHHEEEIEGFTDKVLELEDGRLKFATE